MPPAPGRASLYPVPMAIGGYAGSSIYRVTVDRYEVDRIARSDGVRRDLEYRAQAGTQEAKRLCPVSPDGSGQNPSGHLRSSIGRRTGEDGTSIYVEWGTSVDYWPYVEYSTRPHIIRSHGDYPLRDKHGRVFGQEVHHPGTEAQPFLVPSLDTALRANR